jgi:serine/threonine-protein kinase PknK
MADVDSRATQRSLTPDIPAELRDAGFDDVAEIGHGGFGVVYRCVQPILDRTIAVKVLTSDLDPDNLDRFMREQRAMGRLSGHPHIVQILEVGTTASGRPFIVMPYHAKDSLEALIRRHGPLNWRETLSIGVKLAGALDAAHRVGTLHRDVKPANILLTDYGEPQLTDFGIARIAGGFETATGVITGSPAFTAHEVLEGATPTVASDIYSLGATLFCALTGHAAYERRSGEQVVAQYRICGTKACPATWPQPSKWRWRAIRPIVRRPLLSSANGYVRFNAVQAQKSIRWHGPLSWAWSAESHRQRRCGAT